MALLSRGWNIFHISEAYLTHFSLFCMGGGGGVVTFVPVWWRGRCLAGQSEFTSSRWGRRRALKIPKNHNIENEIQNTDTEYRKQRQNTKCRIQNIE